MPLPSLMGSSPSAARNKLSLILFFIGLAIALASGARDSINYIPPTYQLGLLQMLPPLFWVGFALCLLSTLTGIERDGERTFIIKTMLLYMLIPSIPPLLLKNPFAWDTYMHIFEATPIMLSGHVPALSETLPKVFVDYPAGFPGFQILLTSIFEITNVPVIQFAKYYPIFSSAVTFLAILLFFKTFLPSANYRWALLISVLANVYMQFLVSPQSAGLIAGILTLVALEKPGLRWKFIAILLFAFVVVSHPTTAFILLPVIVLAWLLRIALLREVKALRDLAPVFLALWLVWVMFHAVALEESVVGLLAAPQVAPTPVTGVFFLDALIGTAGKRLGGIFYYAPAIRFTALAIFGLASAYYLVTEWLSRAGRRDRNLAIYTAFLIAPVVMTVVDVAFLKEGLHDRYFLFFLLITPILMVRLAERTKGLPIANPVQSSAPVQLEGAKMNGRRLLGWKISLSVLLLLASLNFTTKHYLSSTFVISDETLSASRFVNSKSGSSQVIGGRLTPDLSDPYRSAILRHTPFYKLYPQPLSQLNQQLVIVFDDHDRLWYQVWYGIGKYDFYALADELDHALGKVYSNGRYNIYWFEGGGE